MTLQIARFLAPLFLLQTLWAQPLAQDETAVPGESFLRAKVFGAEFLSDGADWAVLVRQIGGYAGFNQSVAIDSNGLLRCIGFPDSCAEEISPEALDILTQQIAELDPPSWCESSTLRLCNDCLIRTVTLALRADDGDFTEHTASWTFAPSESSIDAGVLHETVMSLVFPVE